MLEREIAAGRAGTDRARALTKLGWICWRDAELASGIEACQRALEETDDVEVRGETYETLTWLYEDELELAQESAKEMVLARQQQGDRGQIARSRLLEAYFRVVTGRSPPWQVFDTEIEVLARLELLDFNPVPEMWAKFTDRLDDSRAILASRLDRARELHDEQFIVACLFQLGEVDTWRGDLDAAAAAIREALLLSDELTGTTYLGSLHACAAGLAAITGRGEDADRHAHEAVRLGTKAITTALGDAAVGTAAFAAGRLGEADDAFVSATARLEAIGMREPARYRYHGDHLEALVGLGELERARELAERLEERAAVFPRPWIEVQAKRGRALVEAAAGHIEPALAAARSAREAAELLPMPFERARTDLVLGRLARRAKQRGAARQSLEAALEVFEKLPAPSWADAARGELQRLGLSRTGDDLTEVEQAVAGAAASGLRNREIAEQLFMSPKTVEAHLARVYRKLGIRSRAELGARLGERPEVKEQG